MWNSDFFINIYDKFSKIAWTQESIGFATLVASFWFFNKTDRKNEKAKLEELVKQTKAQQIDIWLKFQSQVNQVLNEIDNKYNVIASQDGDIKNIYKKDIDDLTREHDDEIRTAVNSIIRLLQRVYTIKKQFAEIYSIDEDDKEVLQLIEKFWEDEVLTYHYFAFNKTKRKIFVSAFYKSKTAEMVSPQFIDFVDKLILEIEKDEKQQEIQIIQHKKKGA